MLRGRWRKTTRQKMKTCKKKLCGKDKLGEPNLVLWWPTHEKTKLGHQFYFLYRILKNIGGEGGNGPPTGTHSFTPVILTLLLWPCQLWYFSLASAFDPSAPQNFCVAANDNSSAGMYILVIFIIIITSHFKFLV